MEANTSLPTHPGPRIRSSIACARCRRSKIKCVNTGVDSTCKACESSGRECSYPPPAPPGTNVKREGGDLNGEKSGESNKRHRHRKSEVIGGVITGTGYRNSLGSSMNGAGNGVSPRKESAATAQSRSDALDPSILTPSLWQEVFEIFQLHFSADLPFLHGPTFLDPTRGAAAALDRIRAASAESRQRDKELPSQEMLLLAVLTLTAKFHSGLVLNLALKTGNKNMEPVMASEYYAAELRDLIIGIESIGEGEPTLEKIQATLMLGLHEWGVTQGMRAWTHIGLAIRHAQAIGLQYEDGLDDSPWAVSLSMNVEANRLVVGTRERRSQSVSTSDDDFTAEEIKRRTFWACFIMDRYLSNGKYRPAMISIEDVRIQLPSSENAFIFGDRVSTGLISEEPSPAGDPNRIRTRKATRKGPYERSSDSTMQDRDEADVLEIPSEVGPMEGMPSRFVRMVEIWSKVAKWSCAGGRKSEFHAPWDHRSQFYQLRQTLLKFQDSLPRHLRLSPSNIQAHLTQRTSSVFTLLHILYSLCHIVLHREYLPFVPVRCEQPEGPLEKSADLDPSSAPVGFWEESARQLFKAARDSIDLVQTCQNRSMLAETPVLGFAMYTVAFAGIYAMNFPHMDDQGYMCFKLGRSGKPSGGEKAARNAVEVVAQMRPRLPMATNWIRTIHRVHKYYARIIEDYKINTQAFRGRPAGDPLRTNRLQESLSLREGGPSGAVEAFQLLERTLKDVGNVEDEDLGNLAERDRKAAPHSRESSVVTEGRSRTNEEPPARDNWTAINTIINAAQSTSNSNYQPKELTRISTDQSQSPFTNGTQHPIRTQYPLDNSPLNSNPTSTPTITATSPYRHQSAPYDLPVSYQTLAQAQPSLNHRSFAPSQTPSQPVLAPLQTQPNPTQATERPMLTAEEAEQWVNSLRTRLGGDDVAAFLDGRDWEQCSLGAYGHVWDGWLSEVWVGSWCS